MVAVVPWWSSCRWWPTHRLQLHHYRTTIGPLAIRQLALLEQPANEILALVDWIRVAAHPGKHVPAQPPQALLLLGSESAQAGGVSVRPLHVLGTTLLIRSHFGRPHTV